MFYYSRRDFEDGVATRVWYLQDGVKRGWQCTPWRDGRATGMTYPLSPDTWDYLYSEEEMTAGVPHAQGETTRAHSGFTK